jgi:hypothetical protein
MIEAETLTRSYRTVTAVDGVTFTARLAPCRNPSDESSL